MFNLISTEFYYQPQNANFDHVDGGPGKISCLPLYAKSPEILHSCKDIAFVRFANINGW